jgi:hypothetical protein
MLIHYPASTESVNQDEATRKEIWTREMRTEQIKMTDAKYVPEHQMTTNQQCYKSATKHVEKQIKKINLKALKLTPKEMAAAQFVLIKRLSLLKYEDKRTKSQIPLDFLVKGKMSSNMMENKQTKDTTTYLAYVVASFNMKK